MAAIRLPALVMTEADIVSFWSKVNKSEPNACWPWSLTPVMGYGHYKLRGERRRAHIVANHLATGVWPVGFCICHTCDNPICCNPAHLFIGTDKVNMQDKVSKGRHPTGDRHWTKLKPHLTRRGESVNTAKLNPDRVREVRLLLAAKELSQQQIADRFGVSQVAISCIDKKKTWKHVL